VEETQEVKADAMSTTVTGEQAQARARIGYPEVVSAFAEVADAISGERDLDSLLHLIAERICTLLDIRRCSVYLRDQRTGVFRGRVGHAVHDIDIAIKRLTAGVEADGFTREILRTQRPVLIGNAQSDPRPVRSAMVAWSVRTMLGVPMVLRGEVIGLLFLDNEDIPHDYVAEEQDLCQTFANLAAIAIAQAKLTADLRATLSTAAQQNATLRRAAALDDRLSNLVLAGANLSEIAGAVTELTGKPASIHDAEFRRLAHAAPAGDGPDHRPLQPASLRHPAVSEALEGLGRKPVVIPAIAAAGLPQRLLVAAVRVGGRISGYLVLREHRSRFGAQDMIVARRTATIIALELSGKQRAYEAESHAIEALVRDLLHGSGDHCSLSRRADYHGLGLSEPHAVVLLSVHERRPQGELSPERIADAFATLAPHVRALPAAVDHGTAVVVEAPDAAAPDKPAWTVKAVVEDIVGHLAADGSVSAAISTVCRGVEDYPGAFEQTRQITRGIATFGAVGQLHVLAAEELGAGRLLLATADRREADRFVRDTLGRLLDTSDDAVADLFLTLQAFFQCSRSVRRSAALLDVHENTIRYRLARIAELTGLDVAGDADVQLAVQLALLILRLEDRLATLEPVTGPASAVDQD